MKSYSTQELQHQWLAVCVAKFEACFSDPSILTKALNIRESISVTQNGQKNTSSMTSDTVLEAFEAIDSGQTSIYNIADISRHGSILINRFGLDLISSLQLKPSDILRYEAVFFYSCSDDCYMVNLNHRHDPANFEIYFEKSLDNASLHYSIRDDAQTYSGHIDEMHLRSISLEPDEAFTYVKALPELLQIIATIAPNHVNQSIINGFMQHYQHLIQTKGLDADILEDIIDEKRLFVDLVDRTITQCIGVRWYEKYKRSLHEIFDGNIHAHLLHKASVHLSNRTFVSLNELKYALVDIIDLIKELDCAANMLMQEFAREKALLELKVEEGLPPPLKSYAQEQLQVIHEVASSSNLSLTAPGLIQVLRQMHVKIQEETEYAKCEIDTLTHDLQQLSAASYVHDDWKKHIQLHLETPAYSSLLDAKLKIERMQRCKFEVEQLISQQKKRYLNAHQSLGDALKKKDVLVNIWNNRKAQVLFVSLSNPLFDTLKWEEIEKDIQKMESMVQELQQNTVNTTSEMIQPALSFLNNTLANSVESFRATAEWRFW